MTTENQTPNTPKRRRGAPLGNTNNLQHGFYSKRAKQLGITDAESHEFSRLKEEIAVLRTFIRRIIEQSANVDDLDTLLPTTRVLNLSLISLSRLMRTEKILWPGESPDEMDMLFQEVLKQYEEAKVYWNQPDQENEAGDSNEPYPPII